MVFAAGNHRSSSDYYPSVYPASLAVAALDVTHRPASFTNYGNWIDISAPGVDICTHAAARPPSWHKCPPSPLLSSPLLHSPHLPSPALSCPLLPSPLLSSPLLSLTSLHSSPTDGRLHHHQWLRIYVRHLDGLPDGFRRSRPAHLTPARRVTPTATVALQPQHPPLTSPC